MRNLYVRNSPPQGRPLMTNSQPWERQLLIPVVIGIPDSLSCIPDSKAQDSGFHKEKFPHSGIRISLHYLVSNREGLVRVGLSWDKHHKPHIVRKSTLKLTTFSSLVFIGTILNE